MLCIECCCVKSIQLVVLCIECYCVKSIQLVMLCIECYCVKSIQLVMLCIEYYWVKSIQLVVLCVEYYCVKSIQLVVLCIECYCVKSIQLVMLCTRLAVLSGSAGLADSAGLAGLVRVCTHAFSLLSSAWPVSHREDRSLSPTLPPLSTQTCPHWWMSMWYRFSNTWQHSSVLPIT